MNSSRTTTQQQHQDQIVQSIVVINTQSQAMITDYHYVMDRVFTILQNPELTNDFLARITDITHNYSQIVNNQQTNTNRSIHILEQLLTRSPTELPIYSRQTRQQPTTTTTPIITPFRTPARTREQTSTAQTRPPTLLRPQRTHNSSSNLINALLTTYLFPSSDIVYEFEFEDTPTNLTGEQISRTTTLTTYNADTMTETRCAISLDDFENGEEIRQINHCHHYFKNTALLNWFQTQSICPICRYDLRTELTTTTSEPSSTST